MLIIIKFRFNFWNFKNLLLHMQSTKTTSFVFFSMQAGVKIEAPKIETFNGQEVEVWPRIVWNPEWGLTFADVKLKLSGVSSVSQSSTLVIEGKHILFENVNLDGALIVRAVENAEVNLALSAWNFEFLSRETLVL